MLSFVVFDVSGVREGHAAGGGGKPALDREFVLRHAYVVGPDDVAVPADVSIDGGIIRCAKKTPDSGGLALQFPVKTSAGEELIVLQTCLLPERERPYLLSLELARHRLMLTFNKLEDWALFDLPADDAGLRLFEEARAAFTEALVIVGGEHTSTTDMQTGGYSAEADRLARRALALAVEASETLTRTQMRVQHAKRMSGELASAAAKVALPKSAITEHETTKSRNALLGSAGVILPTPPQVGVCVGPNQFTPALCKAVQGCCDFVCMPMRWVDMEPTEGRYLFGNTDRWIEWAVRTAKLPIVGGPLIDFRKGVVPEFLYIWEHDYETLRELVYEHVKTLVTRYRRTVSTWTVVSGLHVSSNFTLTLEQVMDLTRLCVMVVRKLQPSAKVQVEIDQPWGEYFAASATRAMPPIMYAEMVNQAGINPDLLALRVEMGQPEPGRATRDLTAFSALLDKYAGLEKPLAIAALSAPSQEVKPNPPLPAAAEGEAEVGGAVAARAALNGGHWRGVWTEASQSEWLAQMLSVAASKPYVHSVCWGELYESGKPAENRHNGLIDATGKAKAGLTRLGEIRAGIKEKKAL